MFISIGLVFDGKYCVFVHLKMSVFDEACWFCSWFGLVFSGKC